MLAETSRYELDPRVSRFNVKVSAGGPLAKLGHSPTISITEFSGEIRVVPGNIAQSNCEIKIVPQSMVVADDIKEKDRAEIQATMLSEVLETAKYPGITFVSSAVEAEQVLEGLYRVRVTGGLGLHGLVRKEMIKAQVAFLGDTVRASGDFAILQSNYGIKLYSVAAGALAVKDELKFMFDVVGRKTA